MADGRINQEMRQLLTKINTLQECIKSMALNPMFVPNTYEHRKRFGMETKKIRSLVILMKILLFSS